MSIKTTDYKKCVKGDTTVGGVLDISRKVLIIPAKTESGPIPDDYPAVTEDIMLT